MKEMRANIENALRENFAALNDSTMSFAEYVKLESENNPNFFRFFFNEEFENDFDIDISDDQRKEFDCFLKSILKNLPRSSSRGAMIKEMYALKPFDRVLVRDSEYNVWDVDMFKREFIFNNRTMYETFLGRWYQCIPYEGNEHLYLTTSPSVMFSKKNK